MSDRPNILIIGGNSFVATSFILQSDDRYHIKTISRTPTNNSNEFVVNDFFNIPEELFHQTDIVINCAAIVHRQQEPPASEFNRINYELALNIAKNAKRAGVQLFIQLSTIAVYGNVKHIDHTTAENPVNAYGKSKLLADNALLKLQDADFGVIIYRPPLIYGTKKAPGNMMRLINLIGKKYPLPFKGQSNKRDFIHIQNLIGYIEAGIQKKRSGIYLVSDNHAVSISALYDLIVKHLNIPNRSFQIPNFFLKLLRLVKPAIYDKLFSSLTVDPSESIHQLNFVPKDLIEKGIKEMTE